MGYRLPPLATLRLFEAAARHNSFKQAADELALTPSAVSHGIDRLENWLAIRLFERNGRNLALTQAGRDFLPHVTEGLSMIATGARRISPIVGERRINVSVAPTFARRWLIPRLGRFRAMYPDIHLQIDTSHRQAVFPLDGVDVAIRMGAGPWPMARSELLFREAVIPVASADYLHGILAGDDSIDWARVDLIGVSSVENDWPTWLEAHGMAMPDARQLHFDNIDLALDGAALGLGVALCRLPLCRDVLDRPDIAPLPFAPLPIPTGYWITMPEGREPRREVDAFLRWLRKEAGSAV
ncbi:LysR substrate-binding domain-containing protein [Oceanibacterium hippocampi]|uniref:Glycine cleavage system transcriptional activator n=1 Tax=Oceanibacterium hippocampi TaxID=745714 RepID=A0A1Y5TSF5_9PROT|nr:LysR substrate-binding domain-containing protein [Oceanibacterium hippocampi]SLN71176.1 Glycine cleavage system transcriptional activator [Oceanibacterium hippocampi]